MESEFRLDPTTHWTVVDHYDIWWVDGVPCVNDSMRLSVTLAIRDADNDHDVVRALFDADLIWTTEGPWDIGGDGWYITIDGPTSDGGTCPYFTLYKAESSDDEE